MTPDADTETDADTDADPAVDERLDEQPIPEEAACPECGAEPTPETEARHQLSALGYLHDDITLACGADGCDEKWTHGVPIGEGGDDALVCDSCSSVMAVHRVVVGEQAMQAWLDGTEKPMIGLHLKCPDCKYWTQSSTRGDPDGRIQVGNPKTTGETEGAEPYGW